MSTIAATDHTKTNLPLLATGTLECIRYVANESGVPAHQLACRVMKAFEKAGERLNTPADNAAAPEYADLVASALSRSTAVDFSEVLGVFFDTDESLVPPAANRVAACYPELEFAQDVVDSVVRYEACHHLRLAFSFAHKAGNNYSRDPHELITDAFIGLQKGLARYEPAQGKTISTFVSHAIRGAIADFIREESPLPKRLITFARRHDDTEEKLTQQLKRKPTRAELADSLQDQSRLLPLYPRLAPQASLSAMETFADPHTDADMIEETVSSRLATGIITKALGQLDANELLVVRAVYMDSMSIRKVSEDMGCTRNQVQNYLESGLRKLRNTPEIVGLT